MLSFIDCCCRWKLTDWSSELSHHSVSHDPRCVITQKTSQSYRWISIIIFWSPQARNQSVSCPIPEITFITNLKLEKTKSFARYWCYTQKDRKPVYQYKLLIFLWRSLVCLGAWSLFNWYNDAWYLVAKNSTIFVTMIFIYLFIYSYVCLSPS